MAGVKGRSGGPRKNAGGARPGAGRPKRKGGEVGEKSANKPKKDKEAALSEEIEALSVLTDGKARDPLDFLLCVQNDPLIDPRLRVRAAIAAAQYKHTKRGDGGKKDEEAERAKRAASKFAASAPPPLALVKNR